jgi:hypothetical protein
MTIKIEPMTKEDLQIRLVDHQIKASICGFDTIEQMDDFKVDASIGMIKFGGGFTHFLGQALARADSENAMKIIKMFRSMCDHHADLYKKFMRNRFMEGLKDNEDPLDMGGSNERN